MSLAREVLITTIMISAVLVNNYRFMETWGHIGSYSANNRKIMVTIQILRMIWIINQAAVEEHRGVIERWWTMGKEDSGSCVPLGLMKGTSSAFRGQCWAVMYRSSFGKKQVFRGLSSVTISLSCSKFCVSGCFMVPDTFTDIFLWTLPMAHNFSHVVTSTW